MKLLIYFDYFVIIFVDFCVVQKMSECLLMDGNFGNLVLCFYVFGWKVEEVVENVCCQVVELVNVDFCEIVWIFGVIEFDNLVIKGVVYFYLGKGKYIIILKIEYKVVFDICCQLECEGFEVIYLELGEDGLIILVLVEVVLCDDIILVLVMYVNNEIGIVNDIVVIGELICFCGVLFYVDVVQLIGKVEIDLDKFKVDLMFFFVYKIYGLKGIGVFYVWCKLCVCIEGQMYGGGYECGMCFGILVIYQIVGMGEVFCIVKEEMVQENVCVLVFCDCFFVQIDGLEEFYINGSMIFCVLYNFNVSFNYVEGELLIMVFKDFVVFFGLVCILVFLELFYVLCVLGCNDELVYSFICFIFGCFIIEEEIDYVVKKVVEVVFKLCELLLLWDMYKEGVDLFQVEWQVY